jgi:pilus assembly protein CpaB
MQRYGGFILLGIAVLLALFTSVLLYNWLEQQRASLRSGELQAVRLPTAPVAVAAVDLFWGTPLTGDMIKLVPFPSDSLPTGAFSTIEGVQGRVLITNITANEPILGNKLAAPDVTQGGIAAVTQAEKRAMAVRVDEVVGVAGFINPGNRVDVLVTLQQTLSQTKTVLQNVLVLATGTQLEARGNGTKPQQVRVITVEVTPEEAEKLALAAHEGKVTMALRNFTNTQPILTSGATVSTLLSSYSLPNGNGGKPGKAPPPAALQVPPAQVEVIKGSTVQTLTFTAP